MKEYKMKDSWTKMYFVVSKVLHLIPFDFLLSEIFVPSEHGDKNFIFFYSALVLQYDLKVRKSDIF